MGSNWEEGNLVFILFFSYYVIIGWQQNLPECIILI